MLFAPDTDLEAFLMSRCDSLALVNGKRSLAPRTAARSSAVPLLLAADRTGTAMASISLHTAQPGK